MFTFNDIKNAYLDDLINRLSDLYYGNDMSHLKMALSKEYNKFMFYNVTEQKNNADFLDDISIKTMDLLLDYFRLNKFNLHADINDPIYDQAKTVKEKAFVTAFNLIEIAARDYHRFRSFATQLDLSQRIIDAAKLTKRDYLRIYNKLYNSQELYSEMENDSENINKEHKKGL